MSHHNSPSTLRIALLALSIVSGCTGSEGASDSGVAGKSSADAAAQRASEAPKSGLPPVERWADGKRAGTLDPGSSEAARHLVIDLGEAFAPILFSDGAAASGEPEPHRFRATYLALARGEFPKDAFGERARDDKYFELYGIMPTLSALRARMQWARELTCMQEVDLEPLVNFSGVVTYVNPKESLRTHRRFLQGARLAARVMAAQKLDDPTLIDPSKLKKRKDQAAVEFFLQERDDTAAIEAAQARLACEGYFKNKGKWTKGLFDWATHEALAEFERRHRIYSWGALGSRTVEVLRQQPAELEQQAVVRALTERAMHAYGAIEDGSAKRGDGTPVTFKGADGRMHEVPNLEQALRDAVVRAFGLHDVEATHAFLTALGELPRDGHRYVAIPAPPRPEYYADDMDLSVVIDRGDVWYEFPYDENGKARSQPVARRPYTTLLVNYLGQRIPLARFGTTIGGWKSELSENVVSWKYKDSPPGEVLWEEIVSAPVWLPPSSTPPRELLKRRKKRKPNEPKWEVNYHETGPSYASAYGLVAAYHRRFKREPDGSVRLGSDEGIRSHGSVDYMSIMRRHSHGCHRLHNHIAVRLFSFVIAHRPHTRSGHQPAAFVMELEHEEEKHRLEIRRGGYLFRLNTPIFVRVEEGRIKGKVDKPIATAIPKYNSECKGYYLPDGGAVIPRPDGTLVPTIAPPCDVGLPLPAPEEEATMPALGGLTPTDSVELSASASSSPSARPLGR